MIWHMNEQCFLFENLCVNFEFQSDKCLQIKKKKILLQSRILSVLVVLVNN